MIKHKTILITAVIAAIIYLLLLQRTQKQEIVVPEIIPIQTQKKEAEAKEAVYQKKIDALNKKGDSLSARLNSTKNLLSDLREKNRTLKGKVQSLILPAKPGSIGLYIDNSCDSLKAEVGKMMMIQAEKDDLQDSLTLQTEQQIKNKDALIAVQRDQYLSLKSSFEINLLQQQLLLKENVLAKKQFRKERVKNRLLRAGVLILTGLLTSSIIAR